MTDFLFFSLIAATPLLLATLGELIAEKSGSLNLGVEGMMLMGAAFGFVTAYQTGNAGLALLGAFAAGALGALVFAFLTVSLRANQVVTGLSLTIFGTGLSRFIGDAYIGLAVPKSASVFFAKVHIPLLGDIPGIGPVLFRHDGFVYLTWIAVVLFTLYIHRTRLGLNMRAVGENTAAADASGINITAHKYLHVVLGGGFCGLGGAYLSLVNVPIFQADVVTGRGWIAVALVIFASWNPVKAFFASFLFGALSILGLRMQSMGVHISQYLFDMLPYVATIVIVVVSTRKNRREDLPPGNLSIPYFREDR
ncbi:MAG: ABC transporter permease [Clostridiales Family XIII bacterium]|jgi:simple sugar transport system permease protein|nr:ABC transporter permease [Clostridiales Family XIII bacterium]